MAVEIKSIQTKKIYKNIVEQMIALISEGSLKSGNKLPPERSLAEMLQVSRASLREALSVMEIMGIVEIRAGEGSFVSNLDVQPFLSLMLPLLLKSKGIEKDLVEVRKLLEISGVKLVVEHMQENASILNELKEIVRKMEICIGEPRESIDLDMQFHKTICTYSDNNILIKALQYIEFILTRTIHFSRERLIMEEGNIDKLLEQHKKIFKAIEKEDAELASKEMEEHLNFVYRSVWK